MPARLAELGAKYPRSLALRSALVQWHVGRREFADAGKVAQQTMETFPNDPESARVTATVYRAAGQWERAAAAATKWRERDPQNPASADLMLADIRLSQGDPAAALRVLAPYTQPLVASRSNMAVATIYLRAQTQLGKEADAKAFLQPLMSRPEDGKLWRAVWMELAGSDIRNVVTAADWLRQIQPPIASGPDAGEKIDLARAWYTLAGRNRAALDEGALDEATKLLDPIVREPSAPVTAVLLRGAVADRGGDVKTAEDCYRRGLVASPDQPDALNNLAYLVLLRGGDLEEALKLITRAVELAPGTSNFYDTLARVQVKRGDRAAAISSFERALKLEPNNLEALIGMATTLCDTGKRDAAVGLLAQIDTIMKNKPAMSPQTRKELDALRATMKASL
jgi:tetratricopeptide (TPR) repeat protein